MMDLLKGMFAKKVAPDALDGRLSNRKPRLVGESRILAAKQAECEKCAQEAENYKKQISTWTAADDHSPALVSQHTAVCAALDEVARRIRKRNERRTE